MANDAKEKKDDKDKGTDCSLSNAEALAKQNEFFLIGDTSPKAMQTLGEAMLRRAYDILHDGPNGVNLTLNISSSGGAVAGGFALAAYMQRIKGMGVDVHTRIQGNAYSMGLIIAQFGTVRLCDALALLHIHDCQAGSWGDTGARKDTEEEIERLKMHVANIFAARNTRGRKSPAWWKREYLDTRKDWFFTADEAWHLGLIDDVTGGYPSA